MGRTVIVSHRHDQLSQLIMRKVYDAVAVSNFKLEFQQGDQLCWLPQVSEPVDEEVQELATLIDQSIFVPSKIVMLSMAGTADDANSGQLRQWYGKNAQEYLWAHQYAIKMVDELEFPYTIIRALPLTNSLASAVISDEGQPLRGRGVSEAELAKVIDHVLSTDQYNGKSLGISAKVEEDQ